MGQYFEMLFLYVNDILSVSSHRVRDAIDKITSFYKAKEESIKEPDIYLGADVAKMMQMPDGHTIWTTSPRTYIKNAVQVVEQLFQEDGEGYTLKNWAKNPFPSGYFCQY